MKNRKNSGFTMAELLLVIAILTVLFGVVAVNVVERQRAQTRLEFDSIAKELFVAAQNHLTLAESQGYPGLGSGDFGVDVLDNYPGLFTGDNIKDVYLVASDSGYAILDQMLPDYALDASVLAGGTYLVCYQSHPAKVLDVFYSKPGQSTFLGATGTELDLTDYSVLMNTSAKASGDYREGQEERRQEYMKNGKRCVVGWYGGGEAIPQGERLDTPTVEIHNEEQLYVKVTDPNVGKKQSDGTDLAYALKLVVEGVTSKAKVYFKLETSSGRISLLDSDSGTRTFSVLLDDVTTDMHFANIKYPGYGADSSSIEDFLPGEDIRIYAVAYSNAALTNIARSPEQTANSLYADGSMVDEAKVEIRNFRHLENLEEEVSDTAVDQIPETFTQLRAVQKSDLDWAEEWIDWTGDETHKRSWEGISLLSAPDTLHPGYSPVSPEYLLSYSGRDDEDPDKIVDHSVSGVSIGVDGSAGLFGELDSGCAVSDLKLIDFSVSSASGDAGALIGKAEGVAVENVVAYNSTSGDTNKITGAASAGGLIGSLRGGSVTDCAAALYVEGGSAAGGLIGSVSDSAEVSHSYSGGHTHYGKYLTTDLNVSGASAGGLIGELSAGSVTDCYSTCSASGTSYAGGLIGTSAGSVTDCYATGLVCKNGTVLTEAAEGFRTLIGSGTADDTNYYLGMVNPGMAADSAEEPAPKNISKNLANYAEIYTDSGVKAYPYDDTLGETYPMKPSGAAGIAAEHYGDWPKAETAVVNTISA